MWGRGDSCRMSSPRDYRGHVPLELSEHPDHRVALRHVDIAHSCPECGLAVPAPFCLVCLGTGHVSADRLLRYEVSLAAQHG